VEIEPSQLGPRRSRKALSDINVTPLVDVMLVLLIIFLITAPMLRQGIDVKLPRSSQREFEESDQDRYIITVTRDQEVYLDESPIPLEHLELKLRQLKSTDGIGALFLKADEAVPYGFVIQVMDRIKRAGIDTLGMVTEPEQREE
jgi:biopolymer transport protein TolR